MGNREFGPGLEEYPGQLEYEQVAAAKQADEEREHEENQQMMKLHSEDRGDK